MIVSASARAGGFLLILPAAVAMLLLSHGPVSPAIEIRDLDDDGRLVRTISLDEAATFQLVFTHSMYGGAVSETYHVVQRSAVHLERSTVRTATGGAAEYYALYGNMRQDADGWVVEVPRLALARLLVRAEPTGSPFLRVGARELPLFDLLPRGHLAELRPVFATAPVAANARP